MKRHAETVENYLRDASLVIPAQAGIQTTPRCLPRPVEDWIPGQARNDGAGRPSFSIV